jgi:Fe-S cluster assembly protein SufD
VSLPITIDLRDAATFPTRRSEDWKWTDLRRYLREAPQPSPALEPAAGGPFTAFGGDEIAFGNGRDEAGSSEVGYTASGERTLRLRFVTQATGTGHQARAAITVEEGASLLLLESYEGSGSAYVANATVRIELKPGAQLHRFVLQDDVADGISLSATDVVLAAGSSFSQTVLTTGAKLQRHETRVAHPGAGATLRLDGLYALDGERHADLTTSVIHEGVGGETVQLTKGVVADRARGVFQGRIVVSPGADKTDARMGHHALLLSDRAEVDAKPELEIYADEVSCAHGNTVGALDDNALFYARSRGIPEPEARAMLTEAFLGQVADRVDHEGLRDFTRAWLASALKALS